MPQMYCTNLFYDGSVVNVAQKFKVLRIKLPGI